MTQPRLIQPGATYLLTRRTVLRHHLFAPDPRIRRIFLYTLAVASARTRVVVHALNLMSTHPHLVVTDTDGRLPEFLHYFHRHLALATKALWKWEGAVWDSRAPSVVELRTPAAVVQECAYLIANPTAAGLVARATDWPGPTTRPSDLGHAVWRIERPTQYFTPDDDRWPPVVELRLELPRAAEQLGSTAGEFRDLVAHEVKLLEKAARAKMREEGRSFLGPDRCREISPYRRTTGSPEPHGQRNPCFAAGSGERDARIESVRRIRAFRAAYRQALESWRAGVREIAFPAGTYLMRRLHRVAIDEPVRATA